MPMTAVEYYRNADVQARMLEGCGARGASAPSAVYVAAIDPECSCLPTWDHAERLAPATISSFWTRGLDISRSLWDQANLIVMIELDYLNVDRPAEPFLRPAEVFLKLEPTYLAAHRVFRALGLNLRSIVTGRGYQFSGQIPLDEPLVDSLSELHEQPPSWLPGVSLRRPHDVTMPLTARQARASAGLGLLIEHLAHLIMRQAARRSPIPVVFNGTVVGTGIVGRECVSIDFSHAGDPLDVRHMRLAFSTYQWHRQRPDVFGTRAATMVPPLATVTRTSESLLTLLMRGRGLDAGARAARTAPGCLPIVTSGVNALLASYRNSPLARFHAMYDADRQTPQPVRAIDTAAMPPCITAMLSHPDPLLLKPEYLQHLVRFILSRGWRAADIGALVQSAYEADHGWGDRWCWMDRRTRAEFEVRVFAGMIAAGSDALVDFNCVSAQEKGVCPRTECAHDLRRDRERLHLAVAV